MTSTSSSANTDDSTIYVVDIPTRENTILNVRQYFSKFGEVVNVQLDQDKNPSTAKVKFANSKEADAAFNSSEAVLNNRWIKMLRHPLQVEAASASPSVDSDQTDETNCSLCKRTFKSKYHRDWHIKRMHNESGFNCPICDETFVSAILCNEHCVIQHPTISAEKKHPNMNAHRQKSDMSPFKHTICFVSKSQH